MNTLMPFRSWPFARSAIARDLPDLMDRFFDGEVTNEWMPRVDVTENKDGYLVKAELPGLKAADVNVSLSGEVLTLSGEKRKEEKRSDENQQVVERYSGSFTRTFRFPTAVKQDGVEATLAEGVLTIRVQKAAEARSAKVKVVEK